MTGSSTNALDEHARAADDLDRADSNDATDDASTGSEGEGSPGASGDAKRTSERRLSVSVSARGLLIAGVIALLVASAGTFGWLYFGARDQLHAQGLHAENVAHAEKLSLDYAVSAAAMNFQDLNGWKAKLVQGTSPELNKKLSDAAESMQQILVPLQWVSTADPLTAKVRSDTNGVYVVDTFVSVKTKTVQAPDPLQSTATYSLTIDGNDNWRITDVGGIGAVTGKP